MNSEYSILKLEENQFDILIPLMKDCFGMDVNIGYFEWKFKSNPAGFVEGFYAIHSSGEVAAYYGVIPEIYVMNGVRTVIYQSCDTMTHSNHRRRGLFQKLATHCFDYLRDNNKLFIIGFGGGQSTPGFIKFGWQEIFKVRYYFYPRLFKFFQPLSNQGIYFIEDYKEIEHLTIKSNASALIYSEKSSVNYKWRVSNPLNEYKTIAFKVNNNNSYTSYLTYYEKIDKVILFDFYFNDKVAGRNLINFLKRRLKPNQKGIISFVQENSQSSEIMKSFGFLSNPFNKGPLHEKVPFIIFGSNDQMNVFGSKEKWQINSYDHDSL